MASRWVVRWLVAGMLGALPAAAMPVPEIPMLRQYSVAQGVPAANVTALAQDREGYLWLATADGLARFDGVSFSTFQHVPGDPQALTGNNVQALYIDRADRIFVGVEGGGLSMLDATRSGFVHWRSETHPLILSNDVFAITGTGDGAIWFGTYAGGLYRLADDGTLSRFVNDPAQPDSLPGDTVMSLEVDRHGDLWVGTDAGLARWKGDGFERFDTPMPDRSMVLSVSADADGGLWIGTFKGLYRREPDGRIHPESLGVGTGITMVSKVRTDSQGELWFATTKGPMRMPAGRSQAIAVDTDYVTRIPTLTINDVLIDHEGGVWFASRAGLQHLPPGWRRFASPNPQPENSSFGYGKLMRGVSMASDGSLWVTASRQGLYRVDADTGALSPVPWAPAARVPNLLGVLEDRNGTLWIGESQALTQREYPSGRWRRWHATDAVDAPLAGEVDQFVELSDGTVWLLILGSGLQARDSAGHVLVNVAVGDGKGLEIGDTEQIAAGADGALWVAGGQGLLTWNGGTQRLDPIPGAPAERVYGFTRSPDGSVWLALLGALQRYRWDGVRLHLQQRVDDRDGFPAVAPGGVLVGRAGEVWATTTRGLVRYSPSNNRLRLYGLRAGLPSQAFYDRPPLLSPHGSAVAATLGGLLLFNPEPEPTLDRALSRAQLRIERVQVRRDEGGFVLPSDADLALEAQDRDLTVVARLLSYADTSAHRYRFRLDGYDADWVSVGASGERVFPRLPPGRYRLQVQAADAYGEWSPIQTRAVAVASPWWDSTPARAAYAAAMLLLVAIAALAYRARLRRRHALELAAQRQRLAEHASLAKTRFLATMGHEVRTPMTGVLGMTELLLDTELAPRQRSYAESIRQAGQHLLRLVDDALDLARIEADKLTLLTAPFDTQELLAQVRDLLQPLAQRKGLAFHFEIAAGLPPWLAGDADRIRQILLNLANNAIKFTERGEVGIAVAWHDGVLSVSVSDTGPGLNADQQQRIFARFEQAEGARTAARYGGSGLGLAICQELAAAMGGSIGVRSTPGYGARFDVQLPLAQAEAPAATDAAPIPAPTRALHLLLVEDDATVAQVLAGLLQRDGHRVVHASHGLAAMAELPGAPFDAALIDLDLPGVDGCALARLIREHGYTLPLIAITARADADAEPEAHAAGMVAFLRKPITPRVLAEALEAGVCGSGLVRDGVLSTPCESPGS
ncbi:MAG: two-component regulator propeller domain-containing protein [Xanthomonadaceae bacterium]|nr:two-component regulator propeller domain-containing protein [Xanthomonadaceae bacterium]